MKRLFLLCIVMALPSILLGGVFEKAEGKGTSVTWRTTDETGVTQFVVFRRELQRPGQIDPWGPEVQVAIVVAKGSGSSYSLEDAGVFKASDRILQYEVRAINGQGTVMEIIKYQTSFTGLTSAAKRTWGSIKAMFR